MFLNTSDLFFFCFLRFFWKVFTTFEIFFPSFISPDYGVFSVMFIFLSVNSNAANIGSSSVPYQMVGAPLAPLCFILITL